MSAWREVPDGTVTVQLKMYERVVGEGEFLRGGVVLQSWKVGEKEICCRMLDEQAKPWRDTYYPLGFGKGEGVIQGRPDGLHVTGTKLDAWDVLVDAIGALLERREK